MWNSLSQPWRVSFEQGWIAYCSGSFPVGAVVSDEFCEIHSVGRIRIFEAVRRDIFRYQGALYHMLK
jgi:hypothetical protein